MHLVRQSTVKPTDENRVARTDGVLVNLLNVVDVVDAIDVKMMQLSRVHDDKRLTTTSVPASPHLVVRLVQ